MEKLYLKFTQHCYQYLLVFPNGYTQTIYPKHISLFPNIMVRSQTTIPTILVNTDNHPQHLYDSFLSANQRFVFAYIAKYINRKQSIYTKYTPSITNKPHHHMPIASKRFYLPNQVNRVPFMKIPFESHRHICIWCVNNL